MRVVLGLCLALLGVGVAKALAYIVAIVGAWVAVFAGMICLDSDVQVRDRSATLIGQKLGATPALIPTIYTNLLILLARPRGIEPLFSP
jgi:hypothetical protein